MSVAKARILIVDDNATNIKVLSDLLIAYGFEVLIAKDGENALQKLRRVLPDLILLDILMPGIDGFETCRRLKADPNTAAIPVIFMTALSDAVDKVKGLTLGAVDYVTKPLQHEEVIARVNVHLTLRNLTQQLEAQNAQLQAEIRSRQLAETALRSSEEKFAKAFHCNPGPIFIATLDEGLLLDVNQNFGSLIGSAPEELRGKTLEELHFWVDSADRAHFFTTLSQAGTLRQQELSIRTTAGEQRCLVLSAEAISISNQACALVMTYDITACKAAQNRVMEQQAFLRSIYEGLGEPIFLVQVVEGKFYSGGVNPAYERAMGITSEAIVGKTPEELFSPQWSQGITEAYRACVTSGEMLICEMMISHDDRSLWWRTNLVPLRNAAGEIDRLVGTCIDITDRKQAEAALRQSEARYRAIVEDQTELIVRTDLNGVITFVNGAYCRYFDQPPTAFIGESFHPRIPPQDLPIVLQAYASLTPEHPIAITEHRIWCDGEERWFQWCNRLIVNAAGMPVECQAVGRDITDRKQMEAKLQQAKEAADTANRAKSTFLASMSHELRTPLHAILGFSELLAIEPDITPVQQESLEIINRSGEHLLALINEVLEVSKIESGQIGLNLAPTDLHLCLTTIEEMFQIKAQARRVQLRFDRAALPRIGQIDEGKLRQVLINLLNNAIKFTPAGGKVVLRAALQPIDSDKHAAVAETERAAEATQTADRPLPHWSIEDGPVLQDPNTQGQPALLIFQVIDTGVGIAPAELDRLFEAFSQTESGRNVKDGTGLGLFISQKLVRLMQGELSVHSQLHQGTVFTVVLPIVLPQDQVLAPAAATHPRIVGLASNQPRYRILIAEDVLENRLYLKQILNRVGFQVREAEDGQRAIAVCQAWQPDLVFMDMQMPVLDGYAAIRQIKQQQPPPVVIAVTAAAFEEDWQAILATGCDDLIPKPFREDTVLTKLAERLGVRYQYDP